MLTYATEYCVIFVLLLVTAYVLPAGLFHYLFFTHRSPATEAMQIQKRRPSPQDIRREIRQSVFALLLFSAYCLIVYHAAKNGGTALYFDFAGRPWWWAAAGFAAAVVLHDLYFYTTHRLMHLPPLFKAVHAGHHRSLTPTPWSILSFQPLETISQFGFLPWRSSSCLCIRRRCSAICCSTAWSTPPGIADTNSSRRRRRSIGCSNTSTQ